MILLVLLVHCVIAACPTSWRVWADGFASIISSLCDCSVQLWRVWTDDFASIISSLCGCSVQLAGKCGLMVLLVLLVHCVIGFASIISSN